MFQVLIGWLRRQARPFSLLDSVEGCKRGARGELDRGQAVAGQAFALCAGVAGQAMMRCRL